MLWRRQGPRSERPRARERAGLQRRAALPLTAGPRMNMTNKQQVLSAEPKATLDFYELLRKQGRPCWFIRHGLQSNAYTFICKSPRAAWKAAADSLRESLREARS